MNSVLILLLMSLGWSAVWAEEVESSLAKLRAERDRLEQRIAEMERSQVVRSPLMGIDVSTPAGREAYARAATAARETSQTTRDRLNSARSETGSVIARVGAPVGSDQGSVANLQQAIQGVRLESDFNRLEGRLNNFDLALNMIESKFDRTILGAYVHEKIGLLLNSGALCEAQRSCASGRAQIDGAKVRRELFPEGDENANSRKYGDKIQRRTTR